MDNGNGGQQMPGGDGQGGQMPTPTPQAPSEPQMPTGGSMPGGMPPQGGSSDQGDQGGTTPPSGM